MSRQYFGYVDPVGVAYDASLIATGQETVSRTQLNSATYSLVASQSLRLVYFTSRKTEAINNISVVTGGTAAGATPTLCRMGLYIVNSDLSITLVAACSNDTTLFAATSTKYTRALTTGAGYTIIAGQRYAFGLLVVTAAALPQFWGVNATNTAIISSTTPILSSSISAQADLPAGPVAFASQGTNGSGILYGEVTP